MAETLRLVVPGGWMSSQDLRDLVGWAGSQGTTELLAGDSQDWLVETTVTTKKGAPPRFLLRQTGSVQSSAFGRFPDPAAPWLSTGVWMDLLEQIGDPGPLDLQFLHDSARTQFPRMGHLRLIARREVHQWSLLVRRPGSTRVVKPENDTYDTGSLARLVAQGLAAWESGDDQFWLGQSVGQGLSGPQAMTGREQEGFHDETADTFAFGLWSPRGQFRLERLRDLAWLSGETGAPRAWLTPSRILLFQGIPSARRAEWESWASRAGWAGRHGELDHAIRAAGASPEAQVARDEVLAHLRTLDRMPPGRGLVVGDQALNRNDGIVAPPFPVLVRSSGSWFWRSGDGLRSGEGSLESVLQDLVAFPSSSVPSSLAPKPSTEQSSSLSTHRCRECLTVYDPRWGDPQAGVGAGTDWEALAPSWSCPVCGGPKSGFSTQS